MNVKTIFIIILTALVTIILMKNTDQVIFWIFGDRYIPKLAILGTMFALGLVVGYLLGRPKKVITLNEDEYKSLDDQATPTSTTPSSELPKTGKPLTDEDRRYLD